MRYMVIWSNVTDSFFLLYMFLHHIFIYKYLFNFYFFITFLFLFFFKCILRDFDIYFFIQIFINLIWAPLCKGYHLRLLFLKLLKQSLLLIHYSFIVSWNLWILRAFKILRVRWNLFYFCSDWRSVVFNLNIIKFFIKNT